MTFTLGVLIGYLLHVVWHRYKLRRYRRGTEIIPFDIRRAR